MSRIGSMTATPFNLSGKRAHLVSCVVVGNEDIVLGGMIGAEGRAPHIPALDQPDVDAGAIQEVDDPLPVIVGESSSPVWSVHLCQPPLRLCDQGPRRGADDSRR